jgi:diguanylate cyclase (GGDEF)-like protein/PAS domain S-box-containing protein
MPWPKPTGLLTFLSSLIPAARPGLDPATAVRERLANLVVLLLLAVASIQIAPSAAAAIGTGTLLGHAAAAVEIGAFLAGLILLAATDRLLRLRPVIVTASVLAIGIALTALLGPAGAGPLWLAAAPNIAAVFLGRRGVVAVLAASGLAWLGLAALYLGGALPWIVAAPTGALFVGLNALLLPLVSAIPLAWLLDDLSAAVRREAALAAGLTAERAKLQAAQRETDLEIQTRRNTQEALRLREAKYRGILAQSEDTVTVLDGDGIVLFAAGGVARTLGWEPSALIGRRLEEVIHPDDRAEAVRRYDELLAAPGSSMAAHFRVLRQDGEAVPVEARAGNRLQDEAVRGIVVNLRDESRLRSAEERLDFYERFDPLTGLPNRDEFCRRLGEEVERARGRGRIFAVLAIGLDRFKRVNELYGPSVGDDLLRQVAHMLSRSFRPGDLVSRLRGDKFLALLSDLHAADDVSELVRKTQTAIARDYALAGGQTALAATIGAALYPNDGETPELLIKNAETAMYLAKEHARGSWRLSDPAMNRRLVDEIKLEDDLSAAVAAGDFIAWFQPRLDLSGAVYGMEALVRWPETGGGLRQPMSFIPAAERTGDIVRIGDQMLEAACRQLLSWRAAGLAPVPISVNLSPSQFRQAELVETIEGIVRNHALPTSLIELELTESSLMADDRGSIRKLHRLREAGFNLSIDDFGTGYSSFSKLKDYPIDTVKIDKTFIDPLPSDGRAGTIAHAIIKLAHSLDCDVVAEGVETAAQRDFLEAADCDFYQGYYFAKPLCPADATALLARNGSGRRERA